MLKRYFILFICFLLYIPLSATTKAYIDSVENSLHTASKSIDKLSSLYILSFEYGFINPRVGINYGEKCLKLAIREHNLRYQLNAYNGIANAYETLANFDSAKYFHQKSFEVANLMKSPGLIAVALANIATCYKQLGNYKKALHYYLQSYKIAEKQPSYNPRIHYHIGEMYMRLGNYKEAEYHSRLGVEKCILFNHHYIIHNLYINLAKCLQYDGKSDSAEMILTHSLKELQNNTDQISVSSCLHALGEVYLANKKYQLAYEAFAKELPIQQELDNKNGIYLAYLNLAYTNAYRNPKNTLPVQTNLIKAESYFPVVKTNPDILMESALKIARVYELINKPSEAIKYYKKYYSLSDSLLNREKYDEILELQTKYETERKDQQIFSLKQSEQIKNLEIKSQNHIIRNRNVVILIVVISVFLLSALAFIYQQKQNIKKTLEGELAIKKAEEQERIRMSKDIHDELGAKLSKINFLSELIIKENNQAHQKKELAQTIAETSRQIITSMRDLIWVLNPENNTLCNLLTNIREYTYDYLEDYTHDVKLNFPEEADNFSITNESHREILMIVKECLNNIVKHSSATVAEMDITIDNQLFSITIKDNGIGIPRDKKDGNGLKNMRVRVESLNGEMITESGKGTGTIITFNIPLNKILKKINTTSVV